MCSLSEAYKDRKFYANTASLESAPLGDPIGTYMLIRIVQTRISPLLNLTLFVPSRPLLHPIIARACDDLCLIVIRIIAFKHCR